MTVLAATRRQSSTLDPAERSCKRRVVAQTGRVPGRPEPHLTRRTGGAPRGCLRRCAMACGHSADEALRLALAQVTDWTQLAHGVTCATTEGALMSHHAKTLWLPGVTMLGCAATVLLALGWLFPAAWWANRTAGTDAVAAAAGILLYVLLGAVGAAWSRRVGGTWRERLGAGLLPLALHMAVGIAAILAAVVAEFQRHPEHALNPQWRVLVVFVIVPALALSIGAAPFLGRAARTRPRGGRSAIGCRRQALGRLRLRAARHPLTHERPAGVAPRRALTCDFGSGPGAYRPAPMAGVSCRCATPTAAAHRRCTRPCSCRPTRPR
jgi:uncharacterized membrane protein YeaQ/YmgE (transglycosylase-associated protein family)